MPVLALDALPDPNLKPTLTVEEAAHYLCLGRASAYEAVRRGEIPAIRIGRRWIVPTAALRALLCLDEATS